jgi:hypothetical protein
MFCVHTEILYQQHRLYSLRILNNINNAAFKGILIVEILKLTT